MAFNLLEATRHDVYPFIDPKDGLKNAAAGKIVLVTGSGSGIGRAIAEAFATAGAGEVILVARRRAPLEETKKIITEATPNCKVTIFSGIDISNLESVKSMFDSLSSPPDVVVSNAAVSLATATVASSDPSTWCQEIDVNVKGAYIVAHHYLNAIHASPQKKEGCLIHVSSNASWRYIPGRSSYALSKVAMNCLSEYINREEESDTSSGGKVRCVAMHPGGVKTGLGGDDLPEAIQRILIDTPELPGGVAVYLSTERAKFLMGRFISATWDLEALEGLKERIEEEDEMMLRTRICGMAR